MNDIFISYARDDRDHAKRLAKALEAQGWSVWWDWKIPAGKTFAEVIKEALAQSRCVVVLWSEVSVDRNWVLEEAEVGRKRKILIPVQIENVEPPIGFSRIHAAQLWDWDGKTSFPEFQRLVADIARILEQSPSEGDAGPPDARKPEPARRVGPGAARRRRRPLLIAGIPVLVAAAVLLFYWQFLAGRVSQNDAPGTSLVQERPGPGAEVDIRSVPSGATVYLDGEVVGTAPVENHRVASGEAALRLVLDGYATLDTTLYLENGTHGSFSFELAKAFEQKGEIPPEPPAQSSVSITSQPSRATVWIDGRRRGLTPLSGLALEPGRYEVEIRRSGCEPFFSTLTVRADRPSSLAADLVATTGDLRITSEPGGASILVDGTFVGVTPHIYSGVTTGSHDVLLQLSGYHEYATPVAVDPGEENHVHARLSPRTGVLRVRVLPSGSIYVDGDRRTRDTNELYKVDLNPGTYRIRAEHAAWGSWEKDVDMEAGEARDLTFDFSQEFQLTVTSQPTGCLVLVDGRVTGKYTPCRLKLRPGQREIGVQRAGYNMGNPQRILLESDLDEPIHFGPYAPKAD